jgi:hypothetical protein
MITYAAFKAGPVRRILAALDPIFLEALDMAQSYAWFRKAIVMLNDSEADRGFFVKAARRYAGVCSPGERELLKGILLLTDFAHVADEISAGEAYGNMTRCGGDFRLAYAACVVNAGY